MNHKECHTVREVMSTHGDDFWREGEIEEGDANIFLIDDIIHTLNSVGLDLKLVERDVS